MLHYAGMAIYKIGILLFNLVPFIVLSSSIETLAANQQG